LENALAWLHGSQYCGYDIRFTENAGNPVDSVENVISRRNRPPAGIEDVRFFWENVLQCRDGGQTNSKGGAVNMTFGNPAGPDSSVAYVVKGKYAGDAVVWIPVSN
jgi:hypothetical protein